MRVWLDPDALRATLSLGHRRAERQSARRNVREPPLESLARSRRRSASSSRYTVRAQGRPRDRRRIRETSSCARAPDGSSVRVKGRRARVELGAFHIRPLRARSTASLPRSSPRFQTPGSNAASTRVAGNPRGDGRAQGTLPAGHGLRRRASIRPRPFNGRHPRESIETLLEAIALVTLRRLLVPEELGARPLIPLLTVPRLRSSGCSPSFPLTSASR